MSPELQQSLAQYGIGGSSPTNSIQDTIDSYAIPTDNTDAPANVKTALSDMGDQTYNNYCQAFVEQTTYGHQGIYDTANDAWNDNLQSGKAVQGTKGLKPGDLLYFTPTQDEPAGHVGIYENGNNFVSATSNGVKSMDINEWQKETGQQLQGYVPIGQ